MFEAQLLVHLGEAQVVAGCNAQPTRRAVRYNELRACNTDREWSQIAAALSPSPFEEKRLKVSTSNSADTPGEAAAWEESRTAL